MQYRAYTRGPKHFWRDGEFRLYLAVLLTGALALTAFSGPSTQNVSLRDGLFQAASLMSSTGYASTDYNLWSEGARTVLVVIMIVGGCAGSAAGGPKAIRYLLVGKMVTREITQTIHPQAVIPVKYKGRAVEGSVLNAVFTLVVLYIFGYFVTGVAVTLLSGTDMVTGFSAALSCLGNIGPPVGAG